jgi:hypothetical protein
VKIYLTPGKTDYSSESNGYVMALRRADHADTLYSFAYVSGVSLPIGEKVKIFLGSGPNHNITGYGDALVRSDHPDIMVSFAQYSGANEQPLQGFKHSRMLEHPCSSRCQYAVDQGLNPNAHHCPRESCHYEESCPEVMKAFERNLTRIQEHLGEPDEFNKELLKGST